MHIKFLEHGKGSAAKASAYVLDKLDHMGNVRAGVEVLRGMQLRLTRFVTPARTCGNTQAESSLGQKRMPQQTSRSKKS